MIIKTYKAFMKFRQISFLLPLSGTKKTKIIKKSLKATPNRHLKYKKVSHWFTQFKINLIKIQSHRQSMKLLMQMNLLRKLMKFTAENQVNEAWNQTWVKNRWKGRIQEMEQIK